MIKTNTAASILSKNSLIKKSVWLVCFILNLVLCVTSQGQTIWNSGSLTFVKTSAGQTDNITTDTHLTRGTRHPIYNAVTESDAGGQNWTPGNTQWAFGTINNWNTLTYQNLWTILGGSGNIPTNIISGPLVAHLLSEDIYLQITFTSWASGSGNFTYTRTTGPALPVTLSSFSVRNNGNRNTLDWTTNSEVNCSHFNVQRSTDGTNFETIGDVITKSSGGNSHTNLDYIYSDDSPSYGYNYYRLEQLDLDGQKYYSKVVKIFQKNKVRNVKIFQNISDPLVIIDVDTENAAIASLKVIDMNGQVVFNEYFYVENGKNRKVLDMENFKTGVFVLQVYVDVLLSYSGKILKK